MFIFTKDRRFIIKTLFSHEKNALVQMSADYLHVSTILNSWIHLIAN